jgi:hypothetical protein
VSIEHLYRNHSIIVAPDPDVKGGWCATVWFHEQLMDRVTSRYEDEALHLAKQHIDLLQRSPK